MAKIKGYNVRVYLGTDLLMGTKSLSFNFGTGSEAVTDADSGDWDENLPTTNNWNVSGEMWYNNAVVGGVGYDDLMDAWLNQTILTVTAQLETGKAWSGLGFITNLVPTGGTAENYVAVNVDILGTGEIS